MKRIIKQSEYSIDDQVLIRDDLENGVKYYSNVENKTAWIHLKNAETYWGKVMTISNVSNYGIYEGKEHPELKVSTEMISGKIVDYKSEFEKESDLNKQDESYCDKLLKLEHRLLKAGKDVNGNIYVSYANCDVEDGVCLSGNPGRGNTFEEACKDYYKKISGKTLVFNYHTPCEKRVTIL